MKKKIIGSQESEQQLVSCIFNIYVFISPQVVDNRREKREENT